MKKRPKLQAAILAALASSSYADDTCLPPDAGKSPLEVFQCFEAKLNSQQKQMGELGAENQNQQQRLDTQQKRIAELGAENQNQQQRLDTQQQKIAERVAEIQALQTDKQQLQQANTALTERLTKLEDTVTGPNRLLTFSSFVELDKKAVIKPGEEWKAPTGYSTFRRGPFRMALWVNVAGDFNHTQSTTVNVYHYVPGNNSWIIDSPIGNWKILGRDWGDNYIDLNISKVGHYYGFGMMTFKLKNVGEKTLEIFAYGVIQEPSRHIQR